MSNTVLLAGQYLPIVSPLHQADACAKLACAVALATGAASARSYGGVACIMVALICFYGFGRVPIRVLLQQLRPFTWVLVVALLFGSGQGGITLVSIGPWCYTTSDLLAGAWVAVRLILLVTSVLWLSLTTAPTDLVQGLRRFMSPCRHLGIPVDVLALSVLIALRFLWVLSGEAQRIRRAQMARGVDYAGGLLGLWRRSTSLVVPLFAAVLRRADALADALVVRGYRLNAQTRSVPYHVTSREALLLAIAVSAGLAGLFLR